MCFVCRLGVVLVVLGFRLPNWMVNKSVYCLSNLKERSRLNTSKIILYEFGNKDNPLHVLNQNIISCYDDLFLLPTLTLLMNWRPLVTHFILRHLWPIIPIYRLLLVVVDHCRMSGWLVQLSSGWLVNLAGLQRLLVNRLLAQVWLWSLLLHLVLVVHLPESADHVGCVLGLWNCASCVVGLSALKSRVVLGTGVALGGKELLGVPSLLSHLDYIVFFPWALSHSVFQRTGCRQRLPSHWENLIRV